MPMIRPEVQAAAWRGREILAGLGLAAAGLWAMWGSFGLLRWLGVAALLAGAGLAAAGWQRWRLRPAEERLGVIEVDEGRVTYWGPLDGGSVATDAMTAVRYDPRSRPGLWILSHGDGPDLHIPVTAAGQDALFDALSALPGLRSGALVAARKVADGPRRTVWRRALSVDTGIRSPQV